MKKTSVPCPHCGQPLTRSQLGKLLSQLRTTFKGGPGRRPNATEGLTPEQIEQRIKWREAKQKERKAKRSARNAKQLPHD